MVITCVHLAKVTNKRLINIARITSNEVQYGNSAQNTISNNIKYVLEDAFLLSLNTKVKHANSDCVQ